MEGKMKNKIFVSLMVSIITLGFAGCQSGKTESVNDKVVNVEVEKAGNFSGDNLLDYSGTIEESETIPLSFSVPGTVKQVYVKEGDYVRAGQLLAVLNDESFKNSYEMSLAIQKQAEDAYKRLLPMYKNGNLPEIKLVEVETNVQQTKSATLIAKKSWDDCKLYSPVDGVVGTKSIQPGMNAMPSLNSITIVKIGKVFANISVSENEIASIKKGDKTKVKIAALNYEEFAGVIEEIGVIADPIGHTYKIKAAINNQNQKLKPGMLCTANLQKKEKIEGIFLPTNSVMVDEKENNYVFVVKDGIASRRPVKTGRLLKSGIEILSGVTEGEDIVTAGTQKLVDKCKVKIVNR